jgi:hypothetical protein
LIKDLSLVLNPTKTNLEHEDIGYWMTGKSGVPWNTFDRTSGLVAIHPLRGFQVKAHLVQSSSYPPKLVLRLPKALPRTSYLKKTSPCKRKYAQQ